MIIELEINGARVIVSGENLSVSVTQDVLEAQSLVKTNDFMLPSPDQIKSLRKSLHESQASFAKRFGVAQATVCRWERGDEKPSGPATLLLKRLMAEVTA